MMMRVLVALITTLSFAFSASAQSTKAPSDNQTRLLDLATDSAKAKEYCKASFYFEWVYETSLQSKHLYNAAEVAFAANDRQRALSLYERIKTEHQEFSKLQTVLQRIKTLKALMSDDGSGTSCTAPPNPLLTVAPPSVAQAPNQNAPSPELLCGNGIIDQGETCDDQNQVDDDGCTNLCTSAPIQHSPSKALPLITTGAGATLLAAGVGAWVYGFLPRLAYGTSNRELDALVDAYNNTDDRNEKELLQEDAQRVQAQLQQERANYDDRFPLRIGGAVAGVVGAALIAGGIVWLTASGE